MEVLETLNKLRVSGAIPGKIADILERFIPQYFEAIDSDPKTQKEANERLLTFLQITEEQAATPFQFEPYHRAVRTPFDYTAFGRDFFRPLIILRQSNILGVEKVDEILKWIDAGNNAIFFANHQIEPDPQVMSLLLERSHPGFSDRITFVAGHRVTEDPLAIPFSMGQNLLCVHSKRHIENPPEQKMEKLAHNKAVMKKMKELLDEGGHCIYVAPSGGRDRPDSNGVFQVAPFDPQSISMFQLMAKQAAKPTRFYPLALWTYPLMPPPTHVEKELIETRKTERTPVHMGFGEMIDLENFPGSETTDKQQRRKALAEQIWSKVNTLYQQLESGDP